MESSLRTMAALMIVSGHPGFDFGKERVFARKLKFEKLPKCIMHELPSECIVTCRREQHLVGHLEPALGSCVSNV